jgi:hypothetical protein
MNGFRGYDAYPRVMGGLRREEEWARRVMAETLGVPVEQHDDGSRPSMHDLTVRYVDRPEAPCEITQAVDPELLEFWRLFEAEGRWIVDGLDGGWAVLVPPSARVRRLRTELPNLLRDFESQGIRQFRASSGNQGHLGKRAERLDVHRLFQGSTDFPGSIYVLPDLPAGRTTGFVPDLSDALASWISHFLRDEERIDVLEKLRDSGAAETHVFVMVAPFADVPFEVTEALIRREPTLPRVAPELPAEVTDVWIVSGWASGAGFRWSAAHGWRLFEKNVLTADARPN